ncbi:hypothetical protein GLOIN_2v1730610 [Rhizophagus irregularis DAOM 181602=DAOM 197198]|nr:hypothetical protein GLOIN_2v1730610 [Rhizophagus irregularis DAOM 181602=DAOM 197198]
MRIIQPTESKKYDLHLSQHCFRSTMWSLEYVIKKKEIRNRQHVSDVFNWSLKDGHQYLLPVHNGLFEEKAVSRGAVSYSINGMGYFDTLKMGEYIDSYLPGGIRPFKYQGIFVPK